MEPRTLEELYRRYAGELYLYAYSLCQNEAQAQDLTAEAFCRDARQRSPSAAALPPGEVVSNTGAK